MEVDKMNNYVAFNMKGFNTPNSDKTYKFDRDLEFDYKDHTFLEKAVINTSFDEITFYLKDGKSYNQYKQEISRELERICFNIIAYTGIHTFTPICDLKAVVDHEGNNITATFNDRLGLRECVMINITCNPKEIENKIFLTESNFDEQSANYKELFWILHNPLPVIQFLGLYDFMSGLISENKAQKYVHTYFRKNKDKYPNVHFEISAKDNKTEEDNFTHLRNVIAHSKQAGVNEFINTAAFINEDHIKQILQVINDLLCNKYPKC